MTLYKIARFHQEDHLISRIFHSRDNKNESSIEDTQRPETSISVIAQFMIHSHPQLCQRVGILSSHVELFCGRQLYMGQFYVKKLHILVYNFVSKCV